MQGYGRGRRSLPPGWVECPAQGEPIQLATNAHLRIIPSKVPLSREFNALIPEAKRYTPQMAVEMCRRKGRQVEMVIDLTKASIGSYYHGHEEFTNRMGIHYVKVACHGHDGPPDAEAVNNVVWEVYKFLENTQSEKYILMHCTHGFNRTGYMMVAVLVRLFGDVGMSVDRSVRRFQASRPPGIYKDAYINGLFKYYHERRDVNKIVTPSVPQWKGVDNDDEEEQEEDTTGREQDAGPPSHDKIFTIGERLPEEEVAHMQQLVFNYIMDHNAGNRRPHFTGSQPVSLTKESLSLLQQHRYWVSWKADGSRYMMWIDKRGCYLINRNYDIVRLQMRMPTQKRTDRAAPDYPVGKPHCNTLVDGELVVDTVKDPVTGKQTYIRRYLIYDVMYVNNQSVMPQAWERRWHIIQTDVVGPRQKEREYIEGRSQVKYINPPLGYLYGEEPCSVRRKEFWPLADSRKIIEKFMPNLCHESDGLILQRTDSTYVANTDVALLKWKDASKNSVDMLLEVAKGPGGKAECRLLLVNSALKRNRQGGPSLTYLEGGRIIFPGGEDPFEFNGRVVECSWNKEEDSWQFMRVREDKNMPNASHVYEKVVHSIFDDLNEELLLKYLESTFWNNMMVYGKDQKAMEQFRPVEPLPLPDEILAAYAAPPPPPPPPDSGYDMDTDHYSPKSPPYWGPVPSPLLGGDGHVGHEQGGPRYLSSPGGLADGNGHDDGDQGVDPMYDEEHGQSDDEPTYIPSKYESGSEAGDE